jgi:predicted transport protein
MKYITLIALLLLKFNIRAQVQVPLKIDTSNFEVKKRYNFIVDYMKQDTISKQMWHPKYKDTEYYNYNCFADWIWRALPPKKILEKFDVRLAELQMINDSLSYFKLEVSNNDTTNMAVFNTYKFYIVTVNGSYYLDNCMEYELYKFIKYETENIIYYVSPFFNKDKREFEKSSLKFDSLRILLKRPPLLQKVKYFMCANEEEMNLLSNIVVWDGGLGGFTNMEQKYIVGLTNNEFFKHEFVHAILGIGAPCFFLGEGVATLYGGLDAGKLTFTNGIAELKECYKTGICNFDTLYARKVYSMYNNNLTYTFAAVFCDWIIEEKGLDIFLELYYDPTITSTNFLKKVSNKFNISENKIKLIINKRIQKNY